MTTVPRVLPALDETNRAFWTGGLAGDLNITRCGSCSTWNHPPTPVCRHCLSTEVHPTPVSGDAVVQTYTVNRHQWGPEESTAYVVAIVELAEQEGLRLTTNVVDCDPEEVRIGMPVRSRFEVVEDVAIPVFAPVV